MITARISGGLANQLYNYTCAYGVSRDLGQELTLDVANYVNGYGEPFQLDALDIPNHKKIYYRRKAGRLSFDHPCEDFIKDYDVVIQDTPHILRSDYAGKNQYHKKTFNAVDAPNPINTRADIVAKAQGHRNIYLAGWWFGCFYEGYEADLRRMLTPKVKSSRLAHFEETIRGQESVALHMRHTSFAFAGQVFGAEYQKAAIAMVLEKHPDVVFYLFSDNIDYVKQTLGSRSNFRYVQTFGGVDGDMDEFFMIRACRHHIPAPISSYSDVACWLGFDPEAINIAIKPYGNVPDFDKVDYRSEEHRLYVQKRKYLSPANVAEWAKKYDALPVSVYPGRDVSAEADGIERALTEGNGDEALRRLEALTVDAFSVSPKDYPRLMAASARANLAAGNLRAAELTFRKAAKFFHVDEKYNRDYANLLLQMGFMRDAALYAAKADQLAGKGDGAAMPDTFAQNPTLSRAYRAIVSGSKKHFIVAPFGRERASNRDFLAVAIQLARAGHRVSVVVRANRKDTPVQVASRDEMREKTVLAPEKGIAIDHYGGATYGATLFQVGENLTDNLPILVERLCQDSGDALPVILARNPDALQVKIPGSRTLYLDIGAWEWDTNNPNLPPYDEYAAQMMAAADHSILQNAATHKALPPERQKDCTFFEASAPWMRGGEVGAVDEPFDFTSRFMDTDEVLELAACVMEVSQRL